MIKKESSSLSRFTQEAHQHIQTNGICPHHPLELLRPPYVPLIPSALLTVLPNPNPKRSSSSCKPQRRQSASPSPRARAPELKKTKQGSLSSSHVCEDSLILQKCLRIPRSQQLPSLSCRSPSSTRKDKEVKTVAAPVAVTVAPASHCWSYSHTSTGRTGGRSTSVRGD